MDERCCRNCVYGKRAEAGWLRIALRRWPGMLVCSVRAEAPGRTCGVYAGSVCRNFCPKPGVQLTAPDDGGCRIPLTQGQYAIVDPENFEALNKYKWCVTRNVHTSYACRGEKGKLILMHRQIMQTPAGMVVDHIDGNGLDNRVRNMRNCTRGANCCNTRTEYGHTGFRGVRYHQHLGKYRATVMYKGKKHVVGEFDDAVEAAKARDRKARQLQGEFAYLNFPELFATAGRIVALAGSLVAYSGAVGTLGRRRIPAA